MIYNLIGYRKRFLIFMLACLSLVALLASDCLALGGDAEDCAKETGELFLDISVSSGDCIEVVLGSLEYACGVLIELSYDTERLSFLTFAVDEELSSLAVVSCSDADGNLRVLIDSIENFCGVWARLFFSVNEMENGALGQGEALSRITASACAAYEATDGGFARLCFGDASAEVDLRGDITLDNAGQENESAVSAQLLDICGAAEGYAVLRVCGKAGGALAAGFEVTVSRENAVGRYTGCRVLPLSENGGEYSLAMLLPLASGAYVTVRRFEYCGGEVISIDKVYCFFVNGLDIERVG